MTWRFGSLVIRLLQISMALARDFVELLHQDSINNHSCGSEKIGQFGRSWKIQDNFLWYNFAFGFFHYNLVMHQFHSRIIPINITELHITWSNNNVLENTDKHFKRVLGTVFIWKKFSGNLCFWKYQVRK